MAWKKSTTTKHTCNMVFGRKTPGCPRCDELLAGAEPVQWGNALQKRMDALVNSYKHVCTPSCGAVCTANEW